VYPITSAMDPSPSLPDYGSPNPDGTPGSWHALPVMAESDPLAIWTVTASSWNGHLR